MQTIIQTKKHRSFKTSCQVKETKAKIFKVYLQIFKFNLNK